MVFTPRELAAELIAIVSLAAGDLVLDPCRGQGAFYDQFPSYVFKDWCEASEGANFFLYEERTDWIISNPPFSQMNQWLEKSSDVATKGFAYLVGSYSITPKRLELIEAKGFYLTRLHLLKVGQWFGTQAFVVFERRNEKPQTLITYSRTVYKSEQKKTGRSTQGTLAA